MATTATDAVPSIAADPPKTIAELLRRLGGVPADRVRFRPTPGSATEEDLLRVLDHEDALCELVEGTLVEKTAGYRESLIAGLIITLMNNYVLPRRLGCVTGPDGTMRLMPGLVRIPDVAFVSRGRLPGGRVPEEPFPDLAPDLVVEVLSKSNTKAEMDRKLREYFEAGVRVVWMVDPKAKAVRVHTGPTARQSTRLKEGDRLDGGDVLPGFSVLVAELFPAEDE